MSIKFDVDVLEKVKECELFPISQNNQKGGKNHEAEEIAQCFESR
jgi:hypothetical protein